jgi:hypothetical protein
MPFKKTTPLPVTMVQEEQSIEEEVEKEIVYKVERILKS